MTVRVPKYRRHKGSNQALIEVNGRRTYLGKYGSPESQEAYRRIVAKLMAPQAESTSPPTARDSLAINDLILRYIRFAKTYYIKNGKLTDEIAAIRSVLRRLRAFYGATPVLHFGPLAFKSLRDSMIQEGLSRKYINDSMSRVRRMFRWGVAEEIIAPTTYQALASVPGLRRGRSAAQESKPILPVSESTVQQTLPYLGSVVADMVVIQQLTAMRPAEVCAIRPCDVNRSGEVWIYCPPVHKCEHVDKDRTVLIGPRAQTILTPYLARDAQTPCFSPCDSESRRRDERFAARKTPLTYGNCRRNSGRATPGRSPGECYSVDSYRRAIHRACDKAFPYEDPTAIGVQADPATAAKKLKEWQRAHRWSPNRLRHATATRIRREFGLEAAQVVLGHSAADVTQIYAERDLQKAANVAKRIG